jgi:hypothetical protein
MWARRHVPVGQADTRWWEQAGRDRRRWTDRVEQCGRDVQQRQRSLKARIPTSAVPHLASDSASRPHPSPRSFDAAPDNSPEPPSESCASTRQSAAHGPGSLSNCLLFDLGDPRRQVARLDFRTLYLDSDDMMRAAPRPDPVRSGKVSCCSRVGLVACVGQSPSARPVYRSLGVAAAWWSLM